ncbi:hypothetical protein R1flu_017028 [Riccia fluitans]|uniref:Uncharacterized protein n=1 Tax=Riccia fluitans TaxID=41844 RepID=A0ABD1YNI8_9MARC
MESLLGTDASNAQATQNGSELDPHEEMAIVQIDQIDEPQPRREVGDARSKNLFDDESNPLRTGAHCTNNGSEEDDDEEILIVDMDHIDKPGVDGEDLLEPGDGIA